MCVFWAIVCQIIGIECGRHSSIQIWLSSQVDRHISFEIEIKKCWVHFCSVKGVKFFIPLYKYLPNDEICFGATFRRSIFSASFQSCTEIDKSSSSSEDDDIVMWTTSIIAESTLA